MFKKGDKVRYIGDPKSRLVYKGEYTVEDVKLGNVIALEEAMGFHDSSIFELVYSAPEIDTNITVKKVDEVHVTIEGTTYHLSREEARKLMESIRGVL